MVARSRGTPTSDRSPQELVDVCFSGGPLHGRRCLMFGPDRYMRLEWETGRPIVYLRESLEGWTSGDGVRWIAGYVVDASFTQQCASAPTSGRREGRAA